MIEESILNSIESKKHSLIVVLKVNTWKPYIGYKIIPLSHFNLDFKI